MIERILKAIGIVGAIVICGGLAFVFAYSMVVKSSSDTPLNLALWAMIGLVVLAGIKLGRPKKKGRT